LPSSTWRGIFLSPAADNQSADIPAVNTSPKSLFGWPLLIIATAAFAVVIPFFFLGDPSGHDFEFHMNSWMEVVSLWKQGVVYPAWAGFAHYGYGEARFIFYPPVSWTIGAILGLLLPWKIVPGTYIWLSLSLSGCSMFWLARNWLTLRDALFAAIFYATNPYYLVIVYWRSAYAELLAGALLPLLILVVLRSRESGRRIVIPLAILVAAAWLTNIPAAIILTYSLGLLVLVLAIEQQSPRVVAKGALAIALGVALAAFYLLPVIYEQKWVTIAQLLAPGVRPEDNFLFTNISDPDHNRFNYLVSLVALSEIIILTIAVALCRKRQISKSLWWYFTLWSLVSASLLLPFSSPAWKYLPQLKFVQLPFRWLLCMNVSLAMLIAFAWRRWAARILICVGLLTVLAFVWHRIQPPWWDSAPDIAKMLADQQTGKGYEGTDEYVPAASDPYEIAQDAKLVTTEDARPIQIRIQQWNAQSKQFTVRAGQRGAIVLRLFNYPAWRVEVNGRTTPTETLDVTGQMVIPIEQGMNSVRITFTRTWDRTIGAIISCVTLFTLIAIEWWRRQSSRPDPYT
jgi:6-pyruvoyl-tetrahydropterin synthase related domain